MIEDDVELANMLIEYLSKFNIQVTNFEEPFLALSALPLESFDLLILDLTLPGMDGIDVCREVTQKHNLPIIISSARHDITDKVTTLELGADDYLPKPYEPRELEVRIKTVLRRYGKQESKTHEPKKFMLNRDKKEITKDNTYLKLTAGEYEVLALLIEREGFVITRDDIFENSNVLGQEYENYGSLSVILSRIRQKIEQNPKNPQHLLTIRGMGYKFIQ